MTAAATLLFFAPDSWLGRLVNRASGRRGFSHVAVELADGTIMDTGPGVGVHVARAHKYAGRPVARVELYGELGEHLAKCLRAKIGQPFAKIIGGALYLEGSCANIVWACWKERPHRDDDGHITPNELAVYFGAELGTTRAWGARAA